MPSIEILDWPPRDSRPYTENCDGHGNEIPTGVASPDQQHCQFEPDLGENASTVDRVDGRGDRLRRLPGLPGRPAPQGDCTPRVATATYQGNRPHPDEDGR